MAAAVAATPRLSSAAGLLALLGEPQPQLRAHALRELDRVVPALWFEVSAGVAQVEALYEDESFPERLQAALLASKVYYYLGELKEALSYALCAGELFDVGDKGDYVQTLLGQCLDEYIRLRQAAAEAEAVDPRLEAIVERLFRRCVADGQTEQ